MSQDREFSLSVRNSQGPPKLMVVVATAARISDHRQNMSHQFCPFDQKGEQETEDTEPSRAMIKHKP